MNQTTQETQITWMIWRFVNSKKWDSNNRDRSAWEDHSGAAPWSKTPRAPPARLGHHSYWAYQPVSQGTKILMMEPIPGDFPTRSGHRSVKWWEAGPSFLYPPILTLRAPSSVWRHPKKIIPPNPYTASPLHCVTRSKKVTRQNPKHFTSPSYPPNLLAARSAESSLHNGASNEIKEVKVCKKCAKLKPYCVPMFDPTMFKPFLDDAKLPTFCAFFVKTVKYLVFFYLSTKNHEQWHSHHVCFMSWTEKYLDFLRALVNWSPQFDSHPFSSLFELQLILWQFNCCRRLFSTRT